MQRTCEQTQAAALLNAHTDKQPAQDSADEEDHGSPPKKSNKPDMVRCRLSCRLGVNTEGGEPDCTG